MHLNCIDLCKAHLEEIYVQQVLSPEQLELANECNYNFDIPDAFNMELIATTLKRLREGKNAEIPIYNFTTHQVDKKKVF